MACSAQPSEPTPVEDPALVRAQEPQWTVDSFKVSGNTLLADAQVDRVLAPWTGSRSISDLKRAASALQSAYAAAGYGAVVAFLPEQPLDKGVIQITVLEGKLSKITVAGHQQFTEASIRAGLPGLQLGATPRLTELDAEIQLVNENPAKQIQVLLQPGQKSGDVEAKIEVSEQPIQRWTLGLDNTGSDRTGEHRLNLGWQHANVGGWDHVLSTQLQTSVEKSNLVKVASLGYRIPFAGHKLAFDGYAAYSDVDGGSSATLAGDLQFAGRGRILGFRLSKYLPRLGELDQRLSAGFEHRAYLNTCQILGLPSGACGPAGESVAVQPLSLDYTLQRGGERPLSGSVTLVHNLHLGGDHTGDASFAAVRPGADSKYTLVRTSLSAGSPLFEDWRISARATAQFTFDPLVPGEQFGLGGIYSVRGYEEREVIGDRGSFGTVEVASPEASGLFGLSQSSLRFIGFADLGYVENLLGTPCNGSSPANGTACSVGSVGVGARFSSGLAEVRFFVAHALKASVHTGKGDTRVHFSINLSF